MNAEFIPDPALLKRFRTMYIAQMATECVALTLVMFWIATVNTLTYAILFAVLASVLIPAMYRQTKNYYSVRNTTAITFSGKHVLVHKRIGKSLYDIATLKSVPVKYLVELYVAGAHTETIDTSVFVDSEGLMRAFAIFKNS